MNHNFKYTLSFKLEFYDDFDDYERFIAPKKRSDFSNFDDVQYESLRVIYKTIGLKRHSVAWTDIELIPTNIKMLLEKIKELKEQGIAYPATGTIYEKMLDESSWYRIWGDKINSYDDDLILNDGYPFSKAYQYPSYIHIQGNFVSEDFKNFVEEEKLTGVDFLWAEDKGKYKAKQWYLIVAKKAISRGFDTPWFDEKIYREFKTNIKPKAFLKKFGQYIADKEKYIQSRYIEYECDFSDKYRTSITSFEAIALGNRLSDDKLLNELVNTFSLVGGRVNGLVIACEPRFLEKYLPETDFAYHWSGADIDNDRRRRILCCNKKTKDLLFKKGFIKEENVSPIAIYKTMPIGCIDLENDTPYPPPICTEDELKAYKKEEKIRRAKFNEKVLPKLKPTMKNTLKLLRHRKKENEEQGNKGISQKKMDLIIESTRVILPKFWLDVLKISNGGEYWFDEKLDCIFIPLQAIDDFHGKEVENRKLESDDYKETVTFFASTMTGDVYAFRKNPSEVIEDAKVILISHEDFSVEREWEGIADFLESILMGL